MAETPDPILIADDGELQDIRELLDELDLPWLECRGFTGAGVPHSASLLVTNSRLGLSSAAERPHCGLHLVVYDEVSRTLRKVLERSDCDLVLERPLSPHTLRLIAEQALYAGPERRRGPRVVVSAPVKLKGEGRARTATLVQLSLRGCGLLTDQDLKPGREATVTFPKELTQAEPLEASGPVLSVERAEDDPRQSRVSMAFRLMNGPSRRILSKVMERYGAGAELRPRRAPTAQASPAPEPKPGERRSSARKRFTRRVLAAGAGTSYMLIGRDLSAGGMRVGPSPDLAVGDELKLAVHSRPGLPAIMVKAVVARDDGEDGVLLRFRDVPGSIAARLEKIMEGLPVLTVGKRPTTRPGVVVSEILEHD
jgi:hypothetical protein